jgi:hypothetical protein
MMDAFGNFNIFGIFFFTKIRGWSFSDKQLSQQITADMPERCNLKTKFSG